MYLNCYYGARYIMGFKLKEYLKKEINGIENMGSIQAFDYDKIIKVVDKLNRSTTFIGITQIILAIAMLAVASVQVWIELR
jgi:hypothetical protein